jgi:PAS domain S-box-containing protein
MPELSSSTPRALREGEWTPDASSLRAAAVEVLPVGLFLLDLGQADAHIIDLNPTFERATGYSRHELLGRSWELLHGPDSNPATVAEIRNALRQRRAWSGEILSYRKNGTSIWHELSLAPIQDATGQVTHMVATHLDVTLRKQLLEARIRQAHELDRLCLLAGGIAHNLNNFLTVIQGYCDMLLTTSPLADPIREALQQMSKAGEGAVDKARELMTLSRRQMSRRRVFHLGVLLTEFEKMLRRLLGEQLGEHMDLLTVVDPKLGSIEADPRQLEEILLNLVTNACDAMPHGGQLTITMTNVELDADAAPAPAKLPPGPYVLLTVRDTGLGMSEEVLQHLFQPFFSTKGAGKGTGLGLFTVRAIVRELGGDVRVSSKLGQGTKIAIYLPRIDQAAAAEAAEIQEASCNGGSETILLVEYDPGLKDMMRTVLRRHGYTILEARDAAEAVTLCTEHPAPIHLVLTDAVNPQMSGSELIEGVRQARPEIKFLYLSSQKLELDVSFLLKPFSMSELLRKMREVLNQGPNPSLPSTEAAS